MRHTYCVEVESADGSWHPVVGTIGASQGYCYGFVDALRDRPGPRLAYRAMRSDGHVGAFARALESVSIGQVAGFPTAEQYEAAGDRALERARLIRARETR